MPPTLTSFHLAPSARARARAPGKDLRRDTARRRGSAGRRGLARVRHRWVPQDLDRERRVASSAVPGSGVRPRPFWSALPSAWRAPGLGPSSLKSAVRLWPARVEARGSEHDDRARDCAGRSGQPPAAQPPTSPPPPRGLRDGKQSTPRPPVHGVFSPGGQCPRTSLLSSGPSSASQPRRRFRHGGITGGKAAPFASWHRAFHRAGVTLVTVPPIWGCSVARPLTSYMERSVTSVTRPLDGAPGWALGCTFLGAEPA